MDNTTGIDCTTHGVQEVGGMAKRKARKRDKERELTVVVVRPGKPNLEALDLAYQILATCKLA